MKKLILLSLCLIWFYSDAQDIFKLKNKVKTDTVEFRLDGTKQITAYPGINGLYNAGNYITISSDTIYTTPNNTITNIYDGDYSISDSNWEDLLAPATQLKSVGINDKPDFDKDTMGYKMISTDTTEKVGQVYQFQHSVKPNTKYNIHIHWIQSYAAENPRFVVSYSTTAISGIYTTATTMMVCNTKVVAYTSGRMHQISMCPYSVGTGVNISSITDVKLRLTAGGNNPATGVIVKALDIHYRQNSTGSSGVGTK